MSRLATRSASRRPSARQVPTTQAARTSAGGRGELHAREDQQPGGRAGQQHPAAREGEQLEQQQQQAEGGRVGVGQDEVELRAREADGQQHRGRQAGDERREGLARQRVEGDDDRQRQDEAHAERDGQRRAEDLHDARERVDPQRPVEVADVVVGQVPVDRLRRGRQLGAGVDLRRAPFAPAHRDEHREERRQEGQRPRVGRARQGAEPGPQAGLGPRAPDGRGDGRVVRAHARPTGGRGARFRPTACRSCSARAPWPRAAPACTARPRPGFPAGRTSSSTSSPGARDADRAKPTS